MITSCDLKYYNELQHWSRNSCLVINFEFRTIAHTWSLLRVFLTWAISVCHCRSKRRPQVNRVVVRMDNIMHPDQPPAAMTQSLHNDFSRFADNVDSSMAMSTSYNSALRSSASTPTYTGTREQHNHYDSPFFRGVGSPRKKAYTIHPEWASEALSVKKLSLNDRGRDSTDSGKSTGSSPKKKVKERNERRHYRFENKYATVPPRRCKSAPPCFSRNRLNPITWQQWYGPNNRWGWRHSWTEFPYSNGVINIIRLSYFAGTFRTFAMDFYGRAVNFGGKLFPRTYGCDACVPSGSSI